jgi:hypothetical protein
VSLSLAEALRLVDLRPGHTYCEKVNGWTVEVRVVADSATPGLGRHTMLQPWAAFPFHAVRTISAEIGLPQIPKPLMLDESDLAPE